MREVFTGGARFDGGHLVEAPLQRRHPGLIPDSLDPRACPTGSPSAHLNPGAEFVQRDMHEIDGVRRALEDLYAISADSELSPQGLIR